MYPLFGENDRYYTKQAHVSAPFSHRYELVYLHVYLIKSIQVMDFMSNRLKVAFRLINFSFLWKGGELRDVL
jgi:hypothetical protein